MTATYKDIGVSIAGHVGQIEIQRPPHNYFDNALINQIADALEAFDRDPACRAVVLCAQGKSFCAGADFANRPSDRRGQRERQAPVQGSDPDLPLEEAHRRGGAGRGHRRRARPGARRRLPRHLQRGALQRQFQPARLSSRASA